MVREFSIREMSEFRDNFTGAVEDIAASTDKRVQRTLRRFRATVIAQGADYSVTEALAQAVGEDFVKIVDTESLAHTEYVDRGEHLKRDGQAELDLDPPFLQHLRVAGLLVSTNPLIMETFAEATLGETSAQSLDEISRLRLVDRVGIALTKYVDQRYFPQNPQ